MTTGSPTVEHRLRRSKRDVVTANLTEEMALNRAEWRKVIQLAFFYVVVTLVITVIVDLPKLFIAGRCSWSDSLLDVDSRGLIVTNVPL